MSDHQSPSTKLLEISAFTDEGYIPLVDYDGWRVAMLRYSEDQDPDQVTRFQRHDETDEVFVLLEGKCLLYLGEGSEEVTEIHGVMMAPLKLYNVKKGCWHAHTPSPDASVLIIENVDTTDDNSPYYELNEAQKAKIISLAKEAYG